MIDKHNCASVLLNFGLDLALEGGPGVTRFVVTSYLGGLLWPLVVIGTAGIDLARVVGLIKPNLLAKVNDFNCVAWRVYVPLELFKFLTEDLYSLCWLFQNLKDLTAEHWPMQGRVTIHYSRRLSNFLGDSESLRVNFIWISVNVNWWNRPSDSLNSIVNLTRAMSVQLIDELWVLSDFSNNISTTRKSLIFISLNWHGSLRSFDDTWVFHLARMGFIPVSLDWNWFVIHQMLGSVSTLVDTAVRWLDRQWPLLPCLLDLVLTWAFALPGPVDRDQSFSLALVELLLTWVFAAGLRCDLHLAMLVIVTSRRRQALELRMVAKHNRDLLVLIKIWLIVDARATLFKVPFDRELLLRDLELIVCPTKVCARSKWGRCLYRNGGLNLSRVVNRCEESYRWLLPHIAGLVNDGHLRIWSNLNFIMNARAIDISTLIDLYLMFAHLTSDQLRPKESIAHIRLLNRKRCLTTLCFQLSLG